MYLCRNEKNKIHKKLICMISGLFQCPLSIFRNTDIKVDKQKIPKTCQTSKFMKKGTLPPPKV